MTTVDPPDRLARSARPRQPGRPPLPRVARLTILALTLAGFFWRLNGLFAPDPGVDEALFGTWARAIASGRDPLLLAQVVDKPPLAFYLQAASLRLAGEPVAWALRLPMMAASTLGLPLLGALVWRLYRDSLSTMLAVSVLAFSPLAARLGHAGILDPLWVSLALAALLAVTSSRPTGPGRPAGWSGFWFGLALLTKYQALFYLPPLLLVAWLSRWRRQAWRGWLLGVAPSLVLLALWTWTRPGPGILARQLANYGGLRMARSWELWPRLAEWGAVWAPALAVPAVVLALAMPLFLAWLIQREDRSTALDQVFVVFVLAFFVLHWFLAVPLWERYVLAALPIVAILVARLTARLWLELPALAAPRFPARRSVPAFVLALTLLQVPVTAAATRAPAPSGIHAVSQVLVDAPYGTVLYDHWFSWRWRYLLFDSGVFVAWFSSPSALVDDLAVFGGAPGDRYLALPVGAPGEPVRRAVSAAGFALRPVNGSTSGPDDAGILLYRLVAP